MTLFLFKQWGSVFWSSFMAKNFVDKDIILVAAGYDIAPNVTLTEIIEQVEIGVERVLEDANGSQVYICGHSAGAHLAAMMLHAKFTEEAAKSLKGLFLVSGVYDLMPILKTDINDNLKMDAAEAEKSSPLFKHEMSSAFTRESIRVLMVYGENDSSSFKAQSNAYSDHLKTSLKIENVVCHEVKGVDHFNVIEDIRHDEFELTREIYDAMNK